MRPVLLIAALLAAVLVVAVINLPLALIVGAASPPAFGYASAQGSIWQGRLTGVYANGVSLGEVTLSLSPGALVTGTVELRYSMRDGALRGDGRLRAAGSRVTVSDATLAGPMTALPLALPIDSTLDMQIDRLVLEDRQCVEAAGSIDTGPLDVAALGGVWRGPPLTGGISCDDGAVLIAQQGESPDGAVDVLLRIDPAAGLWRLAVTLSGVDRMVARVLPDFGFTPVSGGYRLVQTGSIAS